MAWFEFDARHHASGMQGVADQLAHEMFGAHRPAYRTTGKVKAWTFWGARRYIRRKFGSRLIEIVSVRKVASK